MSGQALAQAPWPAAADALGAGHFFYPDLDVYESQYRGRSLERLSIEGASSDPGNWLASPRNPGPSPGSINAVTDATPRPVVLSHLVMQDSDEDPVLRANEVIRVIIQVSTTNGLGNVQLDWWVDDIESFSESRTTSNMVYLGNAQYTGLIPGLANRSILRTRIRADLGSGLELLSPRPDGRAFTPVRARQRAAWPRWAAAWAPAPLTTTTTASRTCT